VTRFTAARHALLLDLLAVAERFPWTVPHRMARDLGIGTRRLLACLRQARAIQRRVEAGRRPRGGDFPVKRAG